MAEHLTALEVERYSSRALLPLELIKTDAHLASCAPCRQLISEKEQTPVAIDQLRAELRTEGSAALDHPSHAELAAFAEQQLDEVEAELIDGHLLLCGECADVIRDTRAFLVSPPASIEHTDAEKPRSSQSLWQRVLSGWRSYTEWSPLQAAGAMAAILLFVGVVAVVWYQSKSNERDLGVARVSPSPVADISPQPTVAPNPSPAVAGPIGNTDAPTPQPNTSPGANQNRIQVENPAIALRDGDRVTIDDAGRVNGLDDLSPSDRKTVERALQSQELEAPDVLETVRGNADTLRGGGSEGVSFAILSPVGTVVMRDRPTLRWGALNGATSYVVDVYDRDFRKVATSKPLANNEWTVEQPLKRGQIYSWHVTATREGQQVTSPKQPAPEAKFVVLEGTKVQELSHALGIYKDSHLTMGVLYAQAGLLDEAERELRLALREDSRSGIANKLLRRVQAMRK